MKLEKTYRSEGSCHGMVSNISKTNKVTPVGPKASKITLITQLPMNWRKDTHLDHTNQKHFPPNNWRFWFPNKYIKSWISCTPWQQVIWCRQVRLAIPAPSPGVRKNCRSLAKGKLTVLLNIFTDQYQLTKHPYQAGIVKDTKSTSYQEKDKIMKYMPHHYPVYGNIVELCLGTIGWSWLRLRMPIT